MDYPMTRIPVRHYGAMMFEIFDKLKNMEPGAEREELVKLTANQMRRDLAQWSHGSCDEEKVAADLARFTDGKIQLDLKNFKFEKFVLPTGNVPQKTIMLLKRTTTVLRKIIMVLRKITRKGIISSLWSHSS